ncbi:zf-RVT domain-containing protein [Cephalotus follicularis]|uniref:Zf-RVT domain-containing protein n=1 Tax=Cephalotus follicularis TaxID=3775 RepID=A0A1Q3CD90_CEPFO|nr:zf-RVT domain-containing protein [Cephalotus follicularis]
MTWALVVPSPSCLILGYSHRGYGNRVIYDSGLPSNATVNTVINGGRWDWPYRSWELIEINSLCANINIRAGPDKIHWIETSKTYSCKSAWDKFRTHSPHVPWHGIVWFSNNIPKHGFCLWTTGHRAHKTLDRLKRYGVVRSSRCVFAVDSKRAMITFSSLVNSLIPYGQKFCCCAMFPGPPSHGNVSRTILPW